MLKVGAFLFVLLVLLAELGQLVRVLIDALGTMLDLLLGRRKGRPLLVQLAIISESMCK